MAKKATTRRPARKPGPGGGRDEMLGDLRGGAEGVARWNARPLEERRGQDFRGIDLARAALVGVDFGSLDFRGACLEGARLAGAWLLECNLDQASLAGANLEQSWCAQARFEGADLEGASLLRCNLRGCDFRGARLHEVNLESACLDGADLCGADLTGACLIGASFKEARYDEHTRWPAGVEPPAGAKWVGTGVPTLDVEVFMRRLPTLVDPRRLGRALEMLKAERFKLFSQVEGGVLRGVVKSQRNPDVVYACRLASDGSFSCCSQDLQQCLGLRGALCKHLLVLVVGLAKAGEVFPAEMQAWVQASRKHRPDLDSEPLAETLLRYKAAQTGELDWRPTETIPEDYYAY